MSRANRNIRSRGKHLPKVQVIVNSDKHTTRIFLTMPGFLAPSYVFSGIPNKESCIMRGVRAIRGLPGHAKAEANDVDWFERCVSSHGIKSLGAGRYSII